MTAALDLIGIPFERGGRDRRRGLDCLGVVLEVLERLGVPEPLRPDPWARLRELYSSEDPAAISAVLAGGQVIPPAWRLVESWPATPTDGLLLVSDPARGWDGSHEAGVGVTYSGRIVTARPRLGVVALPWSRARGRFSQLWELSA